MAKKICPRCEGGIGKHVPTEPRPSLATLERWERAGDHEASDGCSPVEPDGKCEHGHSSWLRLLGYI